MSSGEPRGNRCGGGIEMKEVEFDGAGNGEVVFTG